MFLIANINWICYQPKGAILHNADKLIQWSIPSSGSSIEWPAQWTPCTKTMQILFTNRCWVRYNAISCTWRLIFCRPLIRCVGMICKEVFCMQTNIREQNIETQKFVVAVSNYRFIKYINCRSPYFCIN